jgi:hypothetical protein
MMKKETLDTAIRVGQLIKLLTPLGNASKPFGKRLAKLRSGLDEQVVLAVLAGESEQGVRAPAVIAELDAALRDSMVQLLNVKALLTPDSPHRIYSAAKKARASDVRDVLNAAEAVTRESTQKMKLDQTQRALVLHAFTSAVRNTNWLSPLMHLGLDIGAATIENTSLARVNGSQQGRERLETTLLKLCPTYMEGAGPAPRRRKASTSTAARTRTPVVKAEGLFVTQVVLNADALLRQPDIAALAGTSFLSEEAQPSLANLLKKAATPVMVGPDDTPDVVAQHIVNDLVKGLVARNKAIEAEKVALREKAEATAQASAVDALKQLDPKVLKLLKSNPDLLKSV